MSKPRSAEQALFGQQFRLSADDEQTISELVVKPGKLSGGRKKTTSSVWAYFGQLCRVNAGHTAGNDTADVAALSAKSFDVTVIDDQLYYCKLCLEKAQSDKSSDFRDLKSYSLTSSTDSLRNHLTAVHNILRPVPVSSLSRVCDRLQVALLLLRGRSMLCVLA